jgi:hypothetical protein
MERYIHNENIRRYRRLLAEEKDEEKRNTIRKLLAEEEAKEVPSSPKGHDEKSKHPGAGGIAAQRALKQTWKPLS